MAADAGQGFPAAVRADRQRSTSDEAVDEIAWSDGDVLVVGSSSLKPVSRVFLGSRATKILATPRCPSSFRAVPSRIRQRANPQEDS